MFSIVNEPIPQPVLQPILQPIQAPPDNLASLNNTNTNTNTVNVPAVAGASVPLKQPETGVSVLGMASMMGAAPVGFALSRFGRGRTLVGKREEMLAEIAFGLVNRRLGKNQDA